MAELQALAAGDPRQVGRYRVLARLGVGGMGRVFLARSPGGRPVALKVVRAELAEDPEFRRRFAREVAAARRVGGVFTAAVVDADTEGVPSWLATAYVAGPSLKDAVAEHGPWPEESVRALGAGLAEALEAIHAAGVVHRDLKPSNVLLATDGPRVIDFGISLAAEDTALTQTGAIVGTPGYIAPEQLRGAGAGPASDVFSLGAVLVYAATGAGPFGTGQGQEVNFRAAYEPAELAAVPEGLRGLVERCLEKEAGRRPAVGELVAWLVGRGGQGGRGGQEGHGGHGGHGGQGVAAGLDWLPEPVARAVREQTDNPLPSTPPPSAAPASPAPHRAPVTGAFGPPLPVPPPPQRPPGRDTSRRRLLTIGGGAVTVAGLGVLGYVLTSGDGSGGGTTGGTSGGGDTGGANAAGGDAGGTRGGGPGGDATTVRIAVQASLSETGTGTGTAIGRDLLRAAELAVAEANASGDHPELWFEVFEADDQGTASEAATAAQRAVDDERVLAVLGPALTDTVNEAGPLYSEAGLTFVTASATDPSLTRQGFNAFLRAVPHDLQTGRAIGDLLYDSPAISVTVIDDGTPYGTDAADVVHDRVEDHLLMSATRRSTADTSLTSIAQEATDNGADAVAFLGRHEDAAELASLLGSAGYDGLRISGSGTMDQAFIDAGGTATEGWYVVCPCYDASATNGGRDFAQRFREEYGEAPGQYAPRAYDVTQMIIEAVAGLGPGADRGHVLAKLVVASHAGITGTVSFDGDGEYAGTGPSIYRVASGAFAPLGLAEEYTIDSLD
ncbi:bifunctional serine/threonine-protein kinase/ABC transporter substrate-binding protein [Streptomyces sp. 6N223]|uniref:bifunctional serine/threonine-protein kinase/ABC transporter substrate-binding protein n=1 Tax=Streptomyces sp. 6N223 TaxID=3457412 RepID=UPI003FD64BF8